MNHDVMVKAWRIDHHSKHSDLQKQVREHLVLMRRAFVQKSIIFCKEEHTRVILDQVVYNNQLDIPVIRICFGNMHNRERTEGYVIWSF